MASSTLDKQTPGCNSPHHWLMTLAMNLAILCVICGAGNDTNGHYLAVSSVDIAFACHLWVPITLHPYRSACGIGYSRVK